MMLVLEHLLQILGTEHRLTSPPQVKNLTRFYLGGGSEIINNYWIRFSHDSDNYQGQSLCSLPKPKAEADNTN